MSNKQKRREQSPKDDVEFKRFELMAKNLISVSNKEMRDEMAKEERKKELRKRKVK